MLLAEDLLLLLTDDDTGRNAVDTERLDLALGGAVLLELLERGAVGVTGPGDSAKPGRVVVRNPTATGSSVLDGALAILTARQGDRPKSVVPKLAKGLRARLLADLVAAGMLRAEQGRVLGIFPVGRWPAVERAHEAGVRQGLHEVLVAGRTPTAREVELVGLLSAVDAVPAVLRGVSLPKGELRARAKALAQGNIAGEAVRQALAEVQAAVMAVIIATTVAAGS